MSDVNRRLNTLLGQMRDMRLTMVELEGLRDKYEAQDTKVAVLIHTAATMLLLETEFAK